MMNIQVATNWYSPEPDDFTAERLTLDFGLRAADQFYRELVVPGLGRVWFARQLSWPLAALALHAEMTCDGDAPKPTAICHGIEALACKLEYFAHTDERSSRIVGSRAFDRDEDGTIWTFSQLRLQAQYVRNTHRAAATRTVRTEVGLGFASGRRFDLLELEPVGLALANELLNQSVGPINGGTLRSWLKQWIRGKREVPRSASTLLEALSPESPTLGERELVSTRILDADGANGAKRKRLAEATGRAADVPDIENVIVERLRKAGHRTQADEVIAARAFGAVLDRTRAVVVELTRVIEPARGGVAITDIVRDKGARAAVRALRTAAEQLMEKVRLVDTAREPTSTGFADAIKKTNDNECVRHVVARAGDILCLAGGNVLRGGLFRLLRSSDSLDGLEEGSSRIEPDHTGRTFRIANLHSMLRDLRRREGEV
jgi:hypothetical protein